MERPRIWEESFKVRYYDANRHCHLRLDGIFHYFQEVAGNHADALGVGVDVLRERHQAWLLSRMKLQIHRMPQAGETVKMTTWPSGFQRLFALRNANIKDASGEEIVRITSFWILYDFERRRPLRLPEEVGVPFPDNSDLPVYFPMLGRIRPEGLVAPKEFFLQEHSIDFNDHVNNGQYATFCEDWLAEQLGDAVSIREMTVDFVLATPPHCRMRVLGEVKEREFTVQVEAQAPGEEKMTPRFLARGLYDVLPANTL